MARIRYLKPQFFKDEHIAELSFAERLFFCGLWCFADRNGNLENRPKWLKVEIYPYDDNLNIEEMLNNLEGQFITFYTVADRDYIKINNFCKHQKMHKTEKVLYPDMPGGIKTVQKDLNPFKGNKNRRNGEGYGEWNGEGKGKETYSPDSSKPESEPVVKTKFSPEDIQFVQAMRTDILEFDSNRKFKGSIESWADDIRKLREIDKRSMADIEDLWLLVQEDPFWHKQILSASKFREKFSDLTIKLEEANPFEEARKDMERENR